MSTDRYHIPQTHIDDLYRLAHDVGLRLEQLGIQYFIDSGTLLGAHRHRGQIPWDDDLDFGLLPEHFDAAAERLAEFQQMGYSTAVVDDVLKIYIPDKWVYGPERVVATPTLDLFRYERWRDDAERPIVRLALPRHREAWPCAWYHEDDLFPLRKFAYGPTQLYGAHRGRDYLDRSYPGWQSTVVIDVRGVGTEAEPNVKIDKVTLDFVG